MQIRTDGDYAHSEDVIEQTADYDDCNETRAVLAACEDVPELVAAAREVLERDDLTRQQRREIASVVLSVVWYRRGVILRLNDLAQLFRNLPQRDIRKCSLQIVLSKSTETNRIQVGPEVLNSY